MPPQNGSTIPDSGPTKTCRVCNHQLPVQAIKCPNCGAYQDWRRFFEYFPAQWAAIAAVAAFIGAVVPSAISWLHRPDSNVDMGRPVITDGADFNIRLNNSGDREAELLSGEIVLETSDSIKKTWPLELSPPDYMPGPDIPPGGLKLFGVLRDSFLDVRQFVHDHETALKNCSIRVYIINYRSGQKPLEEDISCKTFAGVLKTATPPGKR
jgi:hypothetical protein